MTTCHPSSPTRLSGRLGDQSGFTMLLALGVMLVAMLLTAAVFTAVQGDVGLTRADLNGKRSYAAAQAGLQAYLNSLNSNSSSSAWWETCSDDSTTGPVTVPGSTTGVSYQYKPVAGCDPVNIVGTLIDPTSGALRMEFTGTSGNESRTIVADFRTLSPLSYLWYTKYETVDTSVSGDPQCATFYYQQPQSWWNQHSDCLIWWGSGDTVRGPMYTQDQLLIDPNTSPPPVFGRPGSSDVTASQVPNSNPNAVCAFSQCQGAQINHPDPDVTPQVPLPTDNANLQNDALNHGVVLTGTTTLTVSGTTASAVTCTTSSSCTTQSIPIDQKPIIYVANASGCTTPAYDPTNVRYQTNGSNDYYGPCGDLYVQGSYSTPLTLAAANDIIVTGNLTNSTDSNLTGTASPSGPATLGLVANQYVRVGHDGVGSSPCPSSNGNPNVTIDGAILTLQHSFFVDNYNCGGAPTSQNHASQGLLTVHGAIIQYFRGIVQLQGSGGYVKNYDYDDRLALMLPPYMFDLQNTQWTVFRETLCSSTAPASSTNSCSYTGP